MKSKLTFDLDSQNRAIILAKVELTEDVRDKIAKQFQENFGSEGTLALLNYLPYTGDNKEFKLISYSGSFEDCLTMMSSFSLAQLQNMSEAIRWEVYNRENGNFSYDKKVKPPKNWFPTSVGGK